jgi:hypothetical protein
MDEGAVHFLRSLPPARIAGAAIGAILWLLAWRQYRERRRRNSGAPDPEDHLWAGLAWSLAVTVVGFVLVLGPISSLWLQRLIAVTLGAGALLTLAIGARIFWLAGSRRD